jgi:hypothetical protein
VRARGSLAVLAAILVCAVPGARETADVLRATGALPAHIANQFDEPIGFAQASNGEYILLDRRAHTVYGIDREKTRVRKIVEVGFEKGRVLGPGVLALSKDDILAVADAPNGVERIQYFALSGALLGGFLLQTRAAPRLAVGPMILNGVGSMSFTGRTFLINRPEDGALISEIDNRGAVLRYVGTLRKTGHESDPDVHIAMNIGLPLMDPSGGFYFVFMAGVPKFQKYDAKGNFVYERHIEGPELDADLRTLPTVWPRRATPEGKSLPFVPPLVRAAAVDPTGRLWISLMQPFTYVYGANGDKLRTVQFFGASVIPVTSLSFASGERVLVTPGCYEFNAK